MEIAGIPPQARRRVRLTAVVAVLSLGLMLYTFAHEETWEYLGVRKFQPYYADLVAILAAGQAKQAGLDVYHAPNPFDPLGRPHVYGPAWLVVGPMGLTVRDAWWIGSLLTFAFVAAAAAVLAPRRLTEALCALLLICSPPVLLGIHRANNDLMVFLLFAAAAWLLARASHLFGTAGGSLLGFSAVLKLYPFVVLPVVLMRPGRWRSLLVVFGFITAGCLLVVWFWREDFRRAAEITPRPQTLFAYGFMINVSIWRAAPIYRLGTMIGWWLGAVTMLALLVPRWRALWNSVPERGFAAFGFLIGATSWAFCYFANNNYPYRFVLVLLAACLWLGQDAATAEHRVGRMQLILWLTVCWLGVPKHWWSRLTDQDPGVTTSAWFWYEIVACFEQASVLILTLALLVSLGGAAFRRVRPLFATT